jgi:hypothetical protein
MMQQKDEFEIWARSRELYLTPNEYGMGTYNDIDTESYWLCWQVAWSKAFEVL